MSLSRVKTVRRERGRQPSADTKCAGTLIVHFPASRSVQNKCLWLKAPGFWYPVKQCNLLRQVLLMEQTLQGGR